MSAILNKVRKDQILIPNVENRTGKPDRERALLRTILWSGSLSVLLYFIVIFTIRRTMLSMEGLFVASSVFALIVFLAALLLRYFGTLGASFLFFTRYTVEEKPKFQPFLSIIIPAYNEEKVLKASVLSLLQMDYPDYEIIIVNDGSTDETALVAESLAGYQKGKEREIRVSVINKPNGGKSSALNAGIQYSTAEYVVCVDGDSHLAAESLTYGMRHFLDPAIGAVAGNVKVMNRYQILTDFQALEYVEGLNMVRSAQSFINMVNIIPGPIGMFRKKAIQDAGWYSGDTFAEDADLTLKLRLAGWKITYEMRAISYTEAPESIYQLLKQRYRWTRGFLQSIGKHKKYLFNAKKGITNTLVLWSMFYEAIIWPNMNIFANLFFITVALLYGMSNLIPLWWVSIALLDVMAALYCVAVDKEELRLVPYALFYRLYFILLIDITKAAATIEEFLGMNMTWGKLDRIGTSHVKS